MSDLAALSVRQPWASLIAVGEKSIEVRSWPTPYRGPLVICSARACAPEHREMPRGVLLALVELIDCRRFRRADAARACCDYVPDSFAFVLADPRLLQPREVRGRLGLFRVDARNLAFASTDAINRPAQAG